MSEPGLRLDYFSVAQTPRMPINMPTVYESGYVVAHKVNPDLALKYVEHTTIGDPEIEAMVKELANLEAKQGHLALRAVLNNQNEEKIEVPHSLREFIERQKSPPDWVDYSSFRAGIKMFHRNSSFILAATLTASLIEGFSTNMSKAFFLTGRWRDQGVRRLNQNIRHTLEVFMPGGLIPYGDGWKLSIRTRIIHERIRNLMNESEEWQPDDWGTSLHSAHMCLASVAFSARMLQHSKKLGAKFSNEESESYVAIWRYVGHLLGVPDTILFRNGDEALQFFEIGNMCEPVPDLEAIASANSVINSTPLIFGIADREQRRSLAKFIYRISRTLIGDTLANQLLYPKFQTFGLLTYARFQDRIFPFINRLFPEYTPEYKLVSFLNLLEFMNYDDEDGISYKMPDHLYSENTTQW